MALVMTTPGFGQEAQKKAEPSPSTKDQRIAEIQKQIEALQAQLEEMKKAEAQPAKDGAVVLPADWVKALSWRSIGPANMSGRIVDLSVFEADPRVWWAATASGGLLKTENNGITFEHQFDKEATVSIGAVAVAPSDKNIVYVGTGESNPRNSASYGDGVYKSTDGGKTWTNVGLKTTFQIGRIIVHPKDPNIVYVGALGRLYGPSEDRGVYKTTDGGKTWNKVLYVDDKSGVIDMRMHPSDPETLIVAFYERQRDEFDVNEPAKRWGPGSGLHKTTDGGKTWKKLTKGLPETQLGRIGLDWYRKDPKVVYAIVESDKIGTGPPQARAGGAYMGIQGEENVEEAKLAFVTEGGPAEKAGLQAGDVIIGFGDKPVAKYDDFVALLRDRKPEEKVKVKVQRGTEEKELEVTLGTRPGGTGGRGGDPNRPFLGSLNSQVENVQDRQGPEGPQTGGVYRSEDGGETWTRINSINPRPMYFSQVRVDPNDETYLYVLGVSLYRSSDGGKTFRGDGGRGVHADQHALWIDPTDGRHMIVGCDGGVYVTFDRMNNWDHYNHVAIGQFYHVAVDPRIPSKVYGGLQDNGSWGGPIMTRSTTGPINEDWISIGGGDGFKCLVDPNDPDLIYFTSQYGAMGRRNLRTGEAASIRPRPASGQRFDFNWNTPFLLSNHNSKIFYAAGNYVFRSLDRGNDIRVISPKLPRKDRDPEKDQQGAHTATALSESPRNPNVLYVGTDDGNLWVTKDGGVNWTEISAKVGLPGPYWVATLEASKYEEGRVYACFDAHRSNDDKPYLFVSEDYGQTWTSINANLPEFGTTRCLREDITNPNLLYCGTEFALFASIDRGQSWTKINNNLPTVCIYDMAQHPTSGELVLATHGRSIWVGDVSALRQITREVVSASATLFQPVTAYRWRSEPRRGGTNRRFTGENPPTGASIYVALAKQPEKVGLKVVDFEGKTVRDLTVPRQAGLHKVPWNLTRTPPSQSRGSGGTAGVVGAVVRGFAGRAGLGPAVEPGMYRLILTVDGKEFAQSIRVEADPAVPATVGANDEAEFDEIDEENNQPQRIDN
jgi:photosystem II stability/assembly factor-like uncharacterized protein